MIKSLAMGYRFNLYPLSPPMGSKGGLKLSTLQLQCWFPWQLAPSLGDLVTIKIYFINKRHLDLSHHLGNSEGFRSSVLEMGMETKYIFLIVNRNIPVPSLLFTHSSLIAKQSHRSKDTGTSLELLSVINNYPVCHHII